MGVDVRAISIYGIRIEWDKRLADRIDELDHYGWGENPHILQDGMDARYMILGPILFNSGSDRWGFNGHSYMAILPNAAKELWKEWKTQFREKFPEFTGYLDEPPTFITLMYY
jgi:hypothetical protein